jgi:hypothetical protein
MPPVLWDVLAALPDDLSGVRDRALLLVGFVGPSGVASWPGSSGPMWLPTPRDWS